ncbi:MAG: hypothetical protein AB1757_30205 [Acidobacteriota bacterium]
MLSVGRELYLEGKVIFCSECFWDGNAILLQTGLAPINNSSIRIYAYRCPACGSFHLKIKGKLLNFRSRQQPLDEAESSSVEDLDSAIDNHGNTEKRHSR